MILRACDSDEEDRSEVVGEEGVDLCSESGGLVVGDGEFGIFDRVKVEEEIIFFIISDFPFYFFSPLFILIQLHYIQANGSRMY